MSYRGVENFYGNIWTWVDGLNINNFVPWVADHGFVSSTYASPYVTTGLTFVSSSGDYVTAIGFGAGCDYAFLGTAVGGSSSTYLTDGLWTATGDMAAYFSSAWSSGANAGAFYWALNNPASYVNRSIGARLAFFA
jgi:hypothetical protein